jgi:hypothetical protein
MHAEADVHAFLAAWREIMSMVAQDEISGAALIAEIELKG